MALQHHYRFCYAAGAVRCASHGWAVSQWLAARTGVPACLRVCVPACLRVCVPACLRACVSACPRVCVPAWLGQAFVHAWADVEKILFY